MTDVSVSAIASAVVTALVGLVAIYVYLLQKRHDLENAATVLAMDIRNAEQVATTVLKQETIPRNQPALFNDNNWVRSKHLLARHLSAEQFTLINGFFEECVEFETARRLKEAVFNAGMLTKADHMQQRLVEHAVGFSGEPAAEEDWNKKRLLIIKMINKEPYMFAPDDPDVRMRSAAARMSKVTGSTAYQRIDHISSIGTRFWRRMLPW